MNSRHLIVGALLCLVMIGTAGASTKRTNLGAVSTGDFGVVGHGFAFAQSFQDTINFEFTSTSSVRGAATPYRLAKANTSLSNAWGVLAGGALTVGQYTFADLAPGSYTVSFVGAAQSLGGYAASYKVAVAAVPEIETWVMLLMGLGLAAYQLHRKQKSLGQQVLNDQSIA